MTFTNILRKNKRQNHTTEEQIQAVVDPIDEPLEISPSSHNKGGRPKSLADAQIIQIIIWKSENISNSEIARRLHVSEKTVRNYIESYSNIK